MDTAERVAFVMSQTVCASAELLAMQLENSQDEKAGRRLTWSPDQFRLVPIRYGLGHNDVIDYLRR